MTKPTIATQIANQKLFNTRLVKLADVVADRARLDAAVSAARPPVSTGNKPAAGQARLGAAVSSPKPLVPQPNNAAAGQSQLNAALASAGPRQPMLPFKSTWRPPSLDVDALGLPRSQESKDRLLALRDDWQQDPYSKYKKNWSDLSHEQNVTSENYNQPRYAMGNSFGAGLRGAVMGTGGGIGEVLGNVVGRPAAWAADNVGRLAGYDFNNQGALNDALAISSDVRNRGFHQMMFPRHSRALDSRLAETEQTVMEHGNPTAQNTWRAGMNIANEATNTLPAAVGMPAAGGLLARIPGVSTAATAISSRVPQFVQNAITYGAGLPVNNKINAPLFLASTIGQSAMTSPLPQAIYEQNKEHIPEGWRDTITNNVIPAVQSAMPMPAIDAVTRNALGAYAPEVIDNMRLPGAALSQIALNAGATGVFNGRETPMTPQEQEYANSIAQQTAADPENPELRRAFRDVMEPQRGAFPAQLQQLDNEVAANPVAEPEVQHSPNAINYGAASGLPTATSNSIIGSAQQAPEEGAAQVSRGDDTDQITLDAPQTEQPTGQPTAPADIDVRQHMPADAKPEDVDTVQTEISGLPGEAIDAARNDPEQTRANGQERHTEETVNNYAQQVPPPENPQDFGRWWNDAQTYAAQAWESLGVPGQIAFGMGMSLGVIGLLGGGLPGVLASLLGFGVAGLTAAGAGAFGDTAQGAVADAGNTIANAGAAVTGGGTAEPAAPVEPPKPLAQDESLKLIQELTAAPDGMQYISQNRDKFNQFAAMSDDDLSSVAQQMSPESRATVNKILIGLKTQVDEGLNKILVPYAVADNLSGTRAALDRVGLKSTSELPALQEKLNRMLQILNADQQAVMTQTGEKNSMITNKSASQIVAQHLAIATLQKAARCWSGYEPVPGKKPYSPDSCRPIGGKKKKKKDKQKA